MKWSIKAWNGFTVPSSFLSMRLAIALFVGTILLGLLGYRLIEGYAFIDAFYMAMITISTVGFTEVQVLSDSGRIFTSIYIFINIGVIAYALAVFSYYVVQGEIFKKMHLNFINASIKKMENHVIVCGYGKYGREISEHLKKHQLPFVIIEQDAAKIEQLQTNGQKMLYIQDDATHDEALLRAGIHQANALVSALPDDSDNLFIVLSARQLNNKINIISRAKDPKSQKKLQMAGANHVVMPEQIGGFYMAAIISKPGAVEFFSFITNEYQSDIAFEELRYENMPISCKGRSLEELHLRRETGINIIGYKAADGHYEVNPTPQTVLKPNSSFIALGSRKQINDLRAYLKLQE